MRKYKKAVAVLLTCGLAAIGGLISSSKVDAGELQTADANGELFSEGALPTGQTGYASVLADTPRSYSYDVQTKITVNDVIYNALEACEERIDISGYALTPNQLYDVYVTVLNSSPELFYVKGSWRYTYSGNTVQYVIPEYTDTGEELIRKKEFFNQTLQSIVSQVDSAWGDVEKALFLHDYLAQNYEYDLNYSVYNVYDFFEQRQGVCQAYMLTYQLLLSEVGIESVAAVSDSMNHAWNYVRLNDQWYHVDVTWDDPVNDRYGLAGHTHFMRSDAGITDSGHSDWEVLQTCSDTAYDAYFWQKTYSPFQYADGKWYYTLFERTTSENVLYSYDFLTGESQSVYRELGLWNVGAGYLMVAASGMDVYGGELYFNTADRICAYNPRTQQVRTVYTLAENGSIFGMRIEDNNIHYWVGQSLGGSGTVYRYALTAPTPTETPIPTQTPTPTETTAPTETPTPTGTLAPTETAAPTQTPAPTESVTDEPLPSETVRAKGDVDGNQVIDASDALAVLKHAAQLAVITDQESVAAADVDGNGQIDASDALEILKIAAQLS